MNKVMKILRMPEWIFLPLITTNCAILGLALFQTNREYGFVESISFALGAGVGLTLALVLMDHALRHRAQCGDVAQPAPPIQASFL